MPSGQNGHAPGPAQPGGLDVGAPPQESTDAAGQPDGAAAADITAYDDTADLAAAPPAEPAPQHVAVPGRLDPVAAARVFDTASTRRRPVVFEEDDELDVPDFLK